jgi:predicted transcriptional regulator YdeE
MNPTNQQLQRDVVVVGIEARVAPSDAASKIPALWARFAREGVAVKPRGDDPGVYAVYCDYERDGAASYTMVLGFAVDAATEVPPGLRRVRLPAGRYARFEVEGQPQPTLWGAWSFINGAWGERGTRRFIADAERYLSAPAADGAVHAALLVGVEEPAPQTSASRTRTSVRSSASGVTRGSSR